MGAVFVLPVMFDLGIHFGFGDCSFTHPLHDPQSAAPTEAKATAKQNNQL